MGYIFNTRIYNNTNKTKPKAKTISIRQVTERQPLNNSPQKIPEVEQSSRDNPKIVRLSK